MCGRCTLAANPEATQLSLPGITGFPEEWAPRYNIAPTQPIAAVLDGRQQKVEFLYWGLVPPWAKDISIGSKLINARSETITEKPSFKNAFQWRRCLILADGFYVWKGSKQGRSSTLYYFQLKDQPVFAFASIYEIWHAPEGGELWSAAIITCAANETVSPIHDRMPVILDRETMSDWLKDSPAKVLTAMMAPYDAAKMTAVEVSPRVNSAQNDSPENIKPVKRLIDL